MSVDRGPFPLATTPVLLARVPGDDPVDTAMIDIGSRGSPRDTVFEETRAQVAALCDIRSDPPDRAAIAAARRKPGTATDCRHLLEREDLRAVLIAVACYCHVDMAVVALRAGKHIYCGQLTRHHIESIAELVRVARDASTGFMAGEQRRSDMGPRQASAQGYRGQELHIILDDSSTRTTPAVQAWLTAHPRVHCHFTPKGASWLSMVDGWFSVLTRTSARPGSLHTVRALIRHIERYPPAWNAHSTPFVWTKERAPIMRKTLRPAR